MLNRRQAIIALLALPAATHAASEDAPPWRGLVVNLSELETPKYPFRAKKIVPCPPGSSPDVVCTETHNQPKYQERYALSVTYQGQVKNFTAQEVWDALNS